MLRRLLVPIAIAAAAVLTLAGGPIVGARAKLPGRMSDRDFWHFVVDASESNGYFRSDNLTSNELGYEKVIPQLLARTSPGGVYLGVGPEQNFTYIAALRPSMAIVFDVRRGNLLVQLMYKALFELAADRAEFVSMLFAKPRPPALGADASVTDLFAAFAPFEGDDAIYERTLAAIDERLTKADGLPLDGPDLTGISRIYRTFFVRGFAVRFAPTYADLMLQSDTAGVQRSFLATDANFRIVKDLESRNLIVPVVGDFAGPKAIRTVAAYLKAHNATVAAFYLSNVEQYLEQDGKWQTFCENVAALPLDAGSTFIRSRTGRGGGFGFGFVSSLGGMLDETRSCGRR